MPCGDFGDFWWLLWLLSPKVPVLGFSALLILKLHVVRYNLAYQPMLAHLLSGSYSQISVRNGNGKSHSGMHSSIPEWSFRIPFRLYLPEWESECIPVFTLGMGMGMNKKAFRLHIFQKFQFLKKSPYLATSAAQKWRGLAGRRFAPPAPSRASLAAFSKF